MPARTPSFASPELILEALRLREGGRDPWILQGLREAEGVLGRLASASGSSLRGLLLHPRPRRIGFRLGGDPELRKLAGLRAAGLLGEARLRQALVQHFLVQPWSGSPS